MCSPQGNSQGLLLRMLARHRRCARRALASGRLRIISARRATKRERRAPAAREVRCEGEAVVRGRDRRAEAVRAVWELGRGERGAARCYRGGRRGAVPGAGQELASFLLDAAGDVRETLAAVIEKGLRENRELGRPLPSSLYGPMAMTLYVWSPSVPRRFEQALDHTRAVVMANEEASRRLVELEYSEKRVLTGAHLTHVGLAHLSADELDRVTAASTTLKGRRVRQARLKAKVGRNDPCPCGGGRKYKRCHG